MTEKGFNLALHYFATHNFFYNCHNMKLIFVLYLICRIDRQTQIVICLFNMQNR